MGSLSQKEIWTKFCRDLEASGNSVLDTDLPNSEMDAAEGLRYITRLLRISLDMNLEHADPAFPTFYQASHETAKIGADNPDNFYQNATVSGAHTYKITGTRGTVPILSFATKANRYAVDGTMASTGEIDIREMEVGENGQFELIVSTERQSGNWLPLAEDSSFLIVRQTFFDKSVEIPATVMIECLNGPDKPALVTMENVANSLSRVPAFVGGTAQTFVRWADLFRAEHRNTLSTTDQSMFFKAGGDPMIYYLHGFWELGAGEALRITSSIPECEGWNFQLNNVWMESLDYRYHPIHVNNESAVLNDDGTVTVIVSAKKPASGNWISTAGHDRGTMLWRWTGAKDHPMPKTEIINV